MPHITKILQNFWLDLVVTQPLSGCNSRSIFKWITTGLNSVFFIFLTRDREPSLHYYLPIVGVRRDWFLPFSRALVQSKTQTALSRIWTLVINSISNVNDYATCVPPRSSCIFDIYFFVVSQYFLTLSFSLIFWNLFSFIYILYNPSIIPF